MFAPSLYHTDEPSRQFRESLLFEAGALSKTLEKTFVCPYLVNLQPADVRGPLSQFQMTTAEKEETRKLLHTINKALGDQALQPGQVNAAFDKWWGDLDSRLEAISSTRLSVPVKRSTRELIEEVLDTVRAMARRTPTEIEKPVALLLDIENSLDWFRGLRPGTLVRHPEFGLGVVQKSEGEGAGLKLTIIFRNGGRKVLAANYAKLQIVTPSDQSETSPDLGVITGDQGTSDGE
jgi:hypothetical protein